MTALNHWGKWLDSDTPTTGVLSSNSIAWEWVNNEICLDCEQADSEIESMDDCPECESRLTDDLSECPECGREKEKEYESIECDSSHTKIMGDWLKGQDGKYEPDKNGEFAAIVNETTVQVVWSKFIATGAPCSPCYPGQIDLDSTGEFKAYTLPDYLLNTD